MKENLTDDAVNIVFASDNNFVRYLGTAILSLSANKLPETKVNITVLDDGINEVNRAKLRQCIIGENVNLDFIKIEALHLGNIQLPVNKRWTKTIYARLFIPDIVAYKRYIYLDGDVLIQSDLKKLFDTDLEGAPIGAVQDGSDADQKRKLLKYHHISINDYFNSGFLLVDADAWKCEKIGERAIEFLGKYAFLAPDQDALNCACMGSWKALDKNFNDHFGRENKNAVIIHYVQKPLRYFEYMCPAIKEMFFSYFRRTPWGSEKLVYPDYTWKNRIKKPTLRFLDSIGVWHIIADMREAALLRKIKKSMQTSPPGILEKCALVYRQWKKNPAVVAITHNRLVRGVIDLERTALCYFYKTFSWSHDRQFQFEGKNYDYFYSPHNFTYRNERIIEIPIAREAFKSVSPDQVLEIGNVLAQYYSTPHDVVDKYEVAAGVANADVETFDTPKRYQLIVSVSTMEHVGFDGEEEKEPLKISHSIENLKRLLVPGGRIIITVPLGYNMFLDELLERHELSIEGFCLKRVSRRNEWKEVPYDEARNARYDYPFPGVNVLFVGIYQKPKN